MPEFKFKTRRPTRSDVPGYTPPRKKAEPPVDLSSVSIQGKTPDSQQEWWASQWLDRKRLSYDYQYRAFGGGPEYFYDIDFLVHTVPLYTIVELLGNHWHTDTLGQDDRLRQLRIEEAMRDIAKIPIQFIEAEDMLNREGVERRLEEIFRG